MGRWAHAPRTGGPRLGRGRKVGRRHGTDPRYKGADRDGAHRQRLPEARGHEQDPGRRAGGASEAHQAVGALRSRSNGNVLAACEPPDALLDPFEASAFGWKTLVLRAEHAPVD